jgi:hypothetical protein
MPEDASAIIGGQVDLAWGEFIAEMDRRYPSADWPEARLHKQRNELLARTTEAADGGRYVDAGDMRADVRDIEGTLAARGDPSFDDSAQEVRLDMARVVVGEGPEPRTVSGRNPQTHEKMDSVLDDPDANLTRLAEWSHAARHALHHSLTVETKRSLGISTLRVAGRTTPSTDIDVFVADWAAVDRTDVMVHPPEPDTALESDREHGPDMG